jgi:hypothetical protein
LKEKNEAKEKSEKTLKEKDEVKKMAQLIVPIVVEASTKYQ